jgi:hypothetical protein
MTLHSNLALPETGGRGDAGHPTRDGPESAQQRLPAATEPNLQRVHVDDAGLAMGRRWLSPDRICASEN